VARPRKSRSDGAVSRRNSSGVALIAVLWLIGILSLLAATVATLSMSAHQEAFGSPGAERLELVADSAIRLTLLKIIAAPRTRNGTLSLDSQLSLFGASVSVTIELESGRIDLNAADDDLLFAFFVTNGWTEPQARTLVARIADWKDADDTTRPSGAELPEYVVAGKQYGPRNAPFEAVDELRQVLGAESLQPGLLDSFTVYTHVAVPSEHAASTRVRAALAWADAYELGDHPWRQENAGQPMILSAGDLVGQVIRIHACARQAGLQSCREAVVRPIGQPNSPFQVFLWRSHPSG
jgi:general secretion pathway protein K